jgi:hypothetical protein
VKHDPATQYLGSIPATVPKIDKMSTFTTVNVLTQKKNMVLLLEIVAEYKTGGE